MAIQAGDELIGIGGLVTELGVPRSTLRLWEAEGLVPPPPFRLQPGDRRVWRRTDVATIRERIESMRGNGRRRSAA